MGSSSTDSAAPESGGRPGSVDGGEEKSSVRVAEGIRSTGNKWTDFQLAVRVSSKRKHELFERLANDPLSPSPSLSLHVFIIRSYGILSSGRRHNTWNILLDTYA